MISNPKTKKERRKKSAPRKISNFPKLSAGKKFGSYYFSVLTTLLHFLLVVTGRIGNMIIESGLLTGGRKERRRVTERKDNGKGIRMEGGCEVVEGI